MTNDPRPFVEDDFDVDDARALTDEIRAHVEHVWELIQQAYTERAWSVLGYDSWDEYCDTEFGASRLRLPREERTEVVASLRDSGMSIRAIAAATGDSYGTVRNALGSGEQNCSPESTDDVDELADELIAAQPPIIGLDGKAYPTKPKPKPVEAEASEGLSPEELARFIELDKRIDAAEERIRQSHLERAAYLRSLSALLSQEEQPLSLDKVKVIAKLLGIAARLIEECCADTDGGVAE